MPDSIYDLSPSFLKLLDPEVIEFIAFFERLKNGQGDGKPNKDKEMGGAR